MEGGAAGLPARSGGLRPGSMMYGRPAQPARLIHLQFLFLNRELNWFHFSCPGWLWQWILGRSLGSHHFWWKVLAGVLWQGTSGSVSTMIWTKTVPHLAPWEPWTLDVYRSFCALQEAQARPLVASGREALPNLELLCWPLCCPPTPPWLGLGDSLFIPGPMLHPASCQQSGLQAGAGLGRWPRVTSHLFPSILCCHKFIPARCG